MKLLRALTRRSPSSIASILSGLVAFVAVAVLAGCRTNDVGSAIEDLSNPASRIRLRAAYALVRHDSSAVEPLIQCAATGSDSLQYISAQLLGQIGDPRALPVLKTLAGDSNEHVRRTALVALGSIADRETVGYLAVILSRDTLPDLRAAAAEGLGDSGDTLAIPALVHALEDTVSSVRKQAVVALHRLWTPKVASALARVLVEDGEEVVRFVAAQSLGQRRAVSARDALRAALGDPSVWVRAEAARSLGKLGDVTVVDDLTLLLEHGKDGPDHDAAREALRKLSHPNVNAAGADASPLDQTVHGE